MDGVKELNVIELSEVMYDERARDGTWCTLPYPLHKKGCPNFPKCPNNRVDFKTLSGYKWWAVIEEFDLVAHAKRMKEKHPHWSERQARCVLYWQRGVKSRLLKKAEKLMKELGGPMGTIILTIPEANGVDVFNTMTHHGLILKPNPDYVYKIMLVGKIE